MNVASLKSIIAVSIGLCAMTHSSIGDAQTQRNNEKPVATFSLSVTDESVKEVLESWGKQAGYEIEWRYTATNLSFIEVGMGLKTPDKYNSLFAPAKTINEAAAIIFSQELTINTGQTISDILPAEKLKACELSARLIIVEKSVDCQKFDNPPK